MLASSAVPGSMAKVFVCSVCMRIAWCSFSWLQLKSSRCNLRSSLQTRHRISKTPFCAGRNSTSPHISTTLCARSILSRIRMYHARCQTSPPLTLKVGANFVSQGQDRSRSHQAPVRRGQPRNCTSLRVRVVLPSHLLALYPHATH